MDFMTQHELTLANGRFHGDEDGKFTFRSPQGQSTIDLIFISPAITPLISSMRVHTLSTSYHNLVTIAWQDTSQVNAPTQPPSLKFHWQPDKLEPYQNSIAQITAEPDSHHPSYESVIDTLTIAAKTNGMAYLQDGNKKRTHHPWFDLQCKDSAVNIKNCRKQARSHHWDSTHADIFYKAKHAHKKLCREKQRDYFAQLRVNLSQASTSQDFWKSVKPFRSKPFVPNAINQKDWERFYHQMQAARESDETEFIGVLHPDLDAPFTRIDIYQAIHKTSNNKAPGLDAIPNEFLKSLPIQGIDLLVDCYNNILESESPPEEWSRSITVMIHKKGDKLNPNNYRPIALLSSLLKLFIQVLQHRLTEWAEKCGILPEAQGGFRQQRGCDDQIHVLNTAVNLGTNNNGKVYACFFDFARAFPSVPHQKLWSKLNDIGVSPKFIRLLRKIYEKSATQVRMTEGLTDPIEITEGLAQGCVLSPLLFSLYTSDIEQVLKDFKAQGIQISPQLALHILLYADDMILMSPSPEGLQMKIRRLTRYFDQLSLKVHMDKTKIIVFRRAGKLKKGLNFTYKGEKIEIVKQYTYLGVPLSSSGLFPLAAEHFRKKGLTALGSTWKIFTRARLEPLDKKYTLFQALVSSTAMYGAHIWSLRYLNEIEKIQYQFHRRLLGLPHGTPSYALRLELNRPSTR